MTGHGNLTFQNNVPAPAPAGLQFADEGLGVEGGDTVVLGADIAAGSYPLFSNDRVINTQGFGLKLYDAEPAGFFMDLFPSFLQITDNVGGSGAVFNTALFNIFDNFGQISGGISGVNGLITDVYPGAVSSPQYTLRNQRFNGVTVAQYMQDEGTAVPFVDEFYLVDILAKGARWGADSIALDGYFGWGFQSPLNPVQNDFFYLTQSDLNSLAYLDQRFDGTKYALIVQNTIPGANRSMLVSGDFNQLDVATTDAVNGNARISVKNAAAVTQGYFEYNTSGNFVRCQANSELRFVNGVTDRLRLTNAFFVFANTRFGSLSTSPTAKVHISAQAAPSGTAPLKFDSNATLMTTPENGAFEYDGTNLYFTTGGVRRTVQLI